jgi:gliding motility-associated-like protein
LIITHPDCFDANAGTITIEQSGGVEPLRYSIDEVNYQSSPIFDQLTGGTYTMTAIDANDCEVKEILWINVPLMVHVELPDDQTVLPGDTVIINAIVNVPYDSLASIVWSGLNNPNCPTCLSQPVAPIITTTYSVIVTSLDGCMDEDAMTLFLERNDEVYVPNIFSPNGDGINDELIIYSGSDVEKILEWVIFDRWGNVVFSANNFLPNNSSSSWDGKTKGRELNPGVFAYRMIVEFHDGQQNILYDDITLIR